MNCYDQKSLSPSGASSHEMQLKDVKLRKYTTTKWTACIACLLHPGHDFVRTLVSCIPDIVMKMLDLLQESRVSPEADSFKKTE